MLAHQSEMWSSPSQIHSTQDGHFNSSGIAATDSMKLTYLVLFHMEEQQLYSRLTLGDPALHRQGDRAQPTSRGNSF